MKKKINIKPYLNQLKELVKNKQYLYFKNGNGYKVLNRNNNKTLFDLLDKAGFFMFHITNRRKLLVGLHQVVLYIYKGYKAYYLNGVVRKGQMEVHHLDHNPGNNSVNNLEYTTPENNKAIATICSVCLRKVCGYYNCEVLFDLDRVTLHHNVSFVDLLLKSLKATGGAWNLNLLERFMNSLPFQQSKLIYHSLIKLNLEGYEV